MANQKISELTQLTGVNSTANTDELVIVDKSDTTMFSSGTNKRITMLDLADAVYERALPSYSVGTTPSPLPTDGVVLFSRLRAGRYMGAMVGPAGVDVAIQPFLGTNAVSFVRPNGNSTTVASVGLALTATGTATAANWASTNLHTSMRRLDYLVTTAATTAVAGWRGAANQFWRGNAAGLGGFYFVNRFAPATGQTVSTRRCFAGFASSTSAPTDVNPSTLVNILGVGRDATDTNWQIMYNDATGTATKVDTGIVMPATDRAAVYELAMFCPPNGTTIYFQFTNLVSGATFATSTTTDIPSNTTALNPWAYASVGGTSSVVGLTLFSLYIETDN